VPDRPATKRHAPTVTAGKNEHSIVASLIQRAPGLVSHFDALEHATTTHLKVISQRQKLSATTHNSHPIKEGDIMR